MIMINSIPIKYRSFDSYAMSHMTLEEILIKILINKTRERWGSIENFLRKIELGEVIDKLKKDLDRR